VWNFFVVLYVGGLVSGYVGPLPTERECLERAARLQMSQSYLGSPYYARCEVRSGRPVIEVLMRIDAPRT
jgi:hypothetical protein